VQVPEGGDMKACPSGKVRFRDDLAARLALATASRKREGGKSERRTYRCPQCAGFHLTSKR
jgi:hypothetical protein